MREGKVMMGAELKGSLVATLAPEVIAATFIIIGIGTIDP
jgi:hypothetical protein